MWCVLFETGWVSGGSKWQCWMDNFLKIVLIHFNTTSSVTRKLPPPMGTHSFPGTILGATCGLVRSFSRVAGERRPQWPHGDEPPPPSTLLWPEHWWPVARAVYWKQAQYEEDLGISVGTHSPEATWWWREQAASRRSEKPRTLLSTKASSTAFSGPVSIVILTPLDSFKISYPWICKISYILGKQHMSDFSIQNLVQTS